MKGSTLISEIIRGEWLLDPHTIDSYFPLVDAILKGKKFDFQSNYERDAEPSALQILDNYGNPLISLDGEAIEVPKGSIARVNMFGEVMAYSDWCTVGADEIVAQLYKAQELKNVDATIFNVDSPGGSVKAIEAFRQFKKYKTKPVVGLFKDALSLGYWAMLEVCDEIYAYGDVSSRVGSVGVVASFRDNKKAMEKLGYTYHEIYPKESEHKNLAFQLARDGNYKMIKEEHLSPLAQKFQGAVKENLPNLKEEIGVLTGKVFYAEKAVELGMITGISDSRDIVKKAKSLAMRKSINQSIY